MLNCDAVCVVDCEQVEHGSDWPDDLLQGGSGQHTGTAGPAGQV